jgi:hypothetical protein
MMWTEVRKTAPCVYCGRDSKKHSVKRKKVRTEEGVQQLIVSTHYCRSCDKYFTNPDGEKHAPIRRGVSWGIILKALRLVEDMTLEQACQALRRQTGYELSPTTLHDWESDRDALLKKIPKEFLELESVGKET